MKAVVILLVLLTAQTFAISEYLECFNPILELAADPDAGEDLVEWIVDLRDTAERLQAQRQRCNDINRDDPPTAIQDRLIQACQAAFTATTAYELNRLRNELIEIDPELAEEFRACFLSELESRKYFAFLMKNIL